MIHFIQNTSHFLNFLLIFERIPNDSAITTPMKRLFFFTFKSVFHNDNNLYPLRFLLGLHVDRCIIVIKPS